jgi:hypothetical protein
VAGNEVIIKKGMVEGGEEAGEGVGAEVLL